MKFHLTTVVIALAYQAFLVQAGPTVTEFKQKTAEGLRLLSLAPDADPVWKTSDEVWELVKVDANFFDLTETYLLETATNARKTQADLDEDAVDPTALPAALIHQSSIRPIIDTLSLPQMQTYLSNLTTFHNRYYNSTYGRSAALWIRDTIADVINSTSSNATVQTFDHSWLQPSIVAKFAATNPDAPRVIVGAHLDSINSRSSPVEEARAPGADDDGSGTVNLMEAFRALASAGFKPSNPVEFHWYAGEERGLLGSQAIAVSYKANSTQVKAMLQIDMSAYVKRNTTARIGFISDFTSPELNEFGVKLANEYTLTPGVLSNRCGYGCSDHASWNRQGYRSAFPFETRFGDHNDFIHTSQDDFAVAGFNWTHSFEYAKLVTAFVYELGA